MSKYLHWFSIVIIPVLLFLVSPIWGSYFKDYKKVEYELLKNSSFGEYGFSDKEWPDVSIHVNGEKVKNGGYILLGIENTGTLPIQSADYEQPITLFFDSDLTPIDYRILSSIPEKLDVDGEIDGNKFTLSPMLLNAGDKFHIEILVKGESDKIPEINARIVGVKEITEKEQTARNGLYIEKVTQELGASSSNHYAIMKLDGFVFGVLAYVALTLFFTSNFERRSKSKIETVMEFSIYVIALGLITPVILMHDTLYYAIAMALVPVSMAFASALLLLKMLKKDIDVGKILGKKLT